MSPGHHTERVAIFRDRQRAVVEDVAELEKDWPEGEIEDRNLRAAAASLIGQLKELTDEMTAIVIEAPISSLEDAKFGFACHEISNARLNLTHLLLYGVNAHHKAISPIPNVGDLRVDPDQIKALVERGYANAGLHFDALRRIGDLVGADIEKLDRS